MAQRTPRTAARMVLLGAAALAVGGCAHEQNDRLRLGRCEKLPVFRVEPHELPPAGPSVTGLDRSDWEPVVFVVPVNGVAHSPQYRPPVFDLDTLGRQRGDFPTVLEALDKGEPDAGEDIWLAARAHGWAVLDALALVPRLVIRPPTATNWSPRVSYERVRDGVSAPLACSGCGEDGMACEDDCCACGGACEAGVASEGG